MSSEAIPWSSEKSLIPGRQTERAEGPSSANYFTEDPLSVPAYPVLLWRGKLIDVNLFPSLRGDGRVSLSHSPSLAQTGTGCGTDTGEIYCTRGTITPSSLSRERGPHTKGYPLIIMAMRRGKERHEYHLPKRLPGSGPNKKSEKHSWSPSPLHRFQIKKFLFILFLFPSLKLILQYTKLNLSSPKLGIESVIWWFFFGSNFLFHGQGL